MPGRKMDPMRARALASRMRRQYPRATTGQLKGMIETGQPLDRSEYEGYTPVPGMTRTGYQGDDLKPLSQMSEQELYARGITPDRPIQGLRRMESSAAYGESDPMTGMTETEAFPESRQPISSRPSISATYDKMFPGGSQPQPSLMGAALDFFPPMARVRSGLNQVGKLMPGGRLLDTGDMMDTADMPAMARGDFMEDLIESTDYGNAYADTIATRRPDTFKSVDDLAEVPMMYDTAIEKAFGLYNRMGKVPPSVAVEVGRLAGLMDVKRAMEDMDSESLRQSMLDDRKDYVEGKEIQPAIDDFGDRNAR